MERVEELLELVAQINPASQADLFYGFVRQANPNDIAFCLAQIKEKGPSYYGRLKFAGQNAWAKDSAFYLSYAVLDKLPTYRTPKAFIGKDMIRKICQAAIWEHMGNTLCPMCNGRGDFKAEGVKTITCPTCQGFRIVSISSERHKAFNMDREEFKTRWENIYLQALKILDRWQGKALAVLIKNYGKEWVSRNVFGM